MINRQIKYIHLSFGLVATYVQPENGNSSYMGGFVSGLIMTGDIEMAHIYGRNGFFMGMEMGLVSGAMSGYVYAKTHNMNPWGEKSNVKVVSKYDYDYSLGPNDGNNIILI